MNPTVVKYVPDDDADGSDSTLVALLLGPPDSAKGDLLVAHPNGSVTCEFDVPRRAPNSDDGNGRTFH